MVLRKLPLPAAFLAAELLAAAFAVSGCGRPTEVAGGGGLETTGGRLSDGAGPAAGARVRLVPADYRPSEGGDFPDSLTATADRDGYYSFRGMSPGDYNLEALQAAGSRRLFRGAVRVLAGVKTAIPEDSLREPGKVRLAWEDGRSGYLYLPGTTWFRKISRGESDTAALVLDSLPAGLLPSLLFADSLSAPSPVPLLDTLSVEAGRTVERTALSSWSHEGVWTLPGLADDWGAVQEGIYPALVRLTAVNFDFAEASAAGEDIRFAGLDGAPLGHEVERWDAEGRRAEIWVALRRHPAGTGPDDGRGFRMVWGKAGAKPPAGIPVFDTADGYVGVWHLSETAVSPPRRFRDATATGLMGLGTVVGPDSAGPVGGSQSFDGGEGYIRMDDGPLHFTDALLVSAWMIPAFSSGDSLPHTILAQWEEKDSAGFWLEYAPDIKGLRLAMGFDRPGKVVVLEAPDMSFASGEAHHVAAGFDGKAVNLWWDGGLVASKPVEPSAARLDNGRDFLIGARGDVTPELAEIRYFRGALDEVRIHRNSTAASAFPLDLILQEPGSTALKLERRR